MNMRLSNVLNRQDRKSMDLSMADSAHRSVQSAFFRIGNKNFSQLDDEMDEDDNVFQSGIVGSTHVASEKMTTQPAASVLTGSSVYASFSSSLASMDATTDSDMDDDDDEASFADDADLIEDRCSIVVASAITRYIEAKIAQKCSNKKKRSGNTQTLVLCEEKPVRWKTTDKNSRRYLELNIKVVKPTANSNSKNESAHGARQLERRVSRAYSSMH